MEETSSYVVKHYSTDSAPQSYFPLIYSKWLRSFRYGNPYFRLVKPADVYYRHYHEHIESILAHPEVCISVAVLSDTHDVVLGFSVYSIPVLHYVYVQKDFRRLGIGARLLPAGSKEFSHLTRIGLDIWHSPKYEDLKFNPFT